MKDNFKKELIKILKKDERIVTENDELNINLLYEYINKLDEELIGLLLNNELTREKFFIKVKDVYVFKQNDFKFFLDENKIDNSYTQYANRIGLSTGGKFLKDINDVVLDFPYKDCILEGGQSTEEGTDVYFEYDEETGDYIEKQAKRKEIFFNQILAKDEIDRLTESKAFANIKRYKDKGAEKIKSFNRKNGVITDNLIIKGNNLLVLYSLRELFKGKIKLIYIDPPYNTGKDEFKYNDNFNHSTWLTFMKSRLEIARELLSNDGSIIISCDDAEQAYLKVLMDSIFKKENFLIGGVVNRASEIASNYAISKHEYFIIYAKNISGFKLKGEERYTISRGTVGNEKQTMPIITFPKGLKCKNVKDEIYKETRKIPNSNENIENLDPIIVKNGKLAKDVRLKARWRSSNDMRNFFNNNCQPTKAKINGVIEEIYFESDRFMPQIKKKIIEKIPSLFLENKRGSKDLEKLGLKGKFKFPKSVDFIKTLISYNASDNDIVMDFQAGSGTTAQAVLELNEKDKKKRQFILVEQMDYIKDVTVKRIINVIKIHNNNSFIYLELAKNNQKAIEKINECKSLNELIALFDELYEKYFLNYNVKVKEFKEKVVKEEEFKNLSLNRQKEIFARMLDLNQLYVNVSDMEDSQFKLSKEDIALTKDFYQIED